jgi:hypothetical protein
MQSWWEGGVAAFQLLVMMGLGWLIVFLVAQVVEQRVGRKRRGKGSGRSVLGWFWNYANPIGIATLLSGAAYLIWSMTWGPGLSAGPTMLVILLMLAAGFLIGFAPGLRRR